MDTLDELRTLHRDLDELGDSLAGVLLQRAQRCLLSWRMEERERYLEQALQRVQESLEREPETHDAARSLNACAIAVA